MSTTASPPDIDQQNIAILPSVIDEWYGITLTFSWQDAPLNQQILEVCCTAGDRQDTVERTLFLKNIFRAIQQSDAWKQFYQMPIQVKCDRNGSDSHKRCVTIPVFTWDDVKSYGEWSFLPDGGNLLIDIR